MRSWWRRGVQIVLGAGLVIGWLMGMGCAHPAPVCPADPGQEVGRAGDRGREGGGAGRVGAAVGQAGEVAAGDTPIVERTVWITPEIRADTRVLGDDIQSAQVTFSSGSQIMLVIALSQGANTAINDRGSIIGTARIDPGLRLDLQIATPLQSGAVYLDGRFASSNLPNVHFQGALVTWPAPPSRPLPPSPSLAPSSPSLP